MGTIDDNRVGIRNIDTVLYNCRREQHIVVVVLEVKDNLFQFFGFHLSVSHSNTCIRHILLNHLFDTRQIADAGINEIHLSITRHLEIDGIGNNLRTKGMYLCLNRIAVGRRGLNDTQVTCPHQRELQGTGNGRRTHSERIDIGLHLAQLLFG